MFSWLAGLLGFVSKVDKLVPMISKLKEIKDDIAELAKDFKEGTISDIAPDLEEIQRDIDDFLKAYNS